jgi:hypothetical protein
VEEWSSTFLTPKTSGNSSKKGPVEDVEDHLSYFTDARAHA